MGRKEKVIIIGGSPSTTCALDSTSATVLVREATLTEANDSGLFSEYNFTTPCVAGGSFLLNSRSCDMYHQCTLLSLT